MSKLKLKYYRQMYLIRRFEETLLEMFENNLLYGIAHTYIGQEHIAVSYINQLDKQRDVIYSNHRSHGHFLAYTDNPYILACELMGKEEGMNRGIGGSQHLYYNNFYSNGIQGGIVSNATGAAWAEKLKDTGAVVTAFLGDGTLCQGIVYESFNIASLWKLPVVFLIENNKYAQSTPISLHTAGTVSDRVKAFDIDTVETDETDPVKLTEIFAEIIAAVREKSLPAAIIVDTYRLAPHSKGPDYRNAGEISVYRQKDPLYMFRAALDLEDVKRIEQEVDEELRKVFLRAEDAPLTKEL